MVLCALASVVAVPAWAGPSEDELGELAEPLATEISTEFLSTPVSRIVEMLQRESGVTFVIDPRYSNSVGNVQVSLRLDGQSVYEVLELIVLSTEIDWLIQNDVVFVSTRDAIVGRRVQTRVYDIRGMLIQVPNYRGPSFDLNDALSNTNSGGSSARQADSRAAGSGGGGEGGLFGDSDITSERPTRQEAVDQIRELIESTAGEPDNWIDGVFVLSELNGNLIVRATPEVLDQVEQTLASIDANLAKMLTIEAHFLVLPHGRVDTLEGRYVMGAEACDALLEAIAEDDNARTLGTLRTVCHNGQRVYTYAGLDVGFLSDAEPVPDSGSVDPTVSVTGNGATIDIESTISFDEQYVSVAVRSDVIHGVERQVASIPLIGPGEGSPVGEVPLEILQQAAVRYRTNVRVPDGGAVLLSGATSMFEDIDADEFEVVLLLRTRIVDDAGQ